MLKLLLGLRFILFEQLYYLKFYYINVVLVKSMLKYLGEKYIIMRVL